MVNGILIVDKPHGPTSHDIVDAARKALGMRAVGHTGTLDPAATGVLPLVLGRATKLSRYLSGQDKSYLATVRLGICTTTLDAQGEVTSTSEVNVDEAAVRAQLQAFVGQISQVPPMHSAKKIGGQKLYKLARAGVEVERTAKLIHIYSIKFIAYEAPDITFEVYVSPGTYVRVLAEDLGKALGCGGHLLSLRRLSCGDFGLDRAVTVAQLEAEPEVALQRLIPAEEALSTLPRIEVPASLRRLMRTGYQLRVADLRQLQLPDFAADTPLVVAERAAAYLPWCARKWRVRTFLAAGVSGG